MTLNVTSSQITSNTATGALENFNIGSKNINKLHVNLSNDLPPNL